jgi:hypothetical protein
MRRARERQVFGVPSRNREGIGRWIVQKVPGATALPKRVAAAARVRSGNEEELSHCGRVWSCFAVCPDSLCFAKFIPVLLLLACLCSAAVLLCCVCVLLRAQPSARQQAWALARKPRDNAQRQEPNNTVRTLSNRSIESGRIIIYFAPAHLYFLTFAPRENAVPSTLEISRANQ